MARSVTVRRHAETATIELRCGGTTLGTVSGLAGTSGGDATMTGRFTHAPAYVEHAERFLELAQAAEAGDAARVAALQAEIEALGLHVHHTQHDMRIDKPGTLTLIKGDVRFAPNDAYLMMRTGGLG